MWTRCWMCLAYASPYIREKWNLPFRAVLANPANLLLGVDKDDPISTPDVWFDHKDRMNYVYATGKIDTMVAQPDLVHVAY